MSERGTDILISAWVIASGGASVLLPFLACDAAARMLTASRACYAIGIAVLLTLAVLRAVRRISRSGARV